MIIHDKVIKFVFTRTTNSKNNRAMKYNSVILKFMSGNIVKG